MSLPKVTIVVVTYNALADTTECLRSLQGVTYGNVEVIVVDNASSDGSARTLAREFPTTVVIANPVNSGYAGGNNVGVRTALERGADYILILNNDTIVDKDVIIELRRVLDSDLSIGAVMPKIMCYDMPTTIQIAGASINRSTGFGRLWRHMRPDDGKIEEPYETDYISGCAFLAQRQVWEKVGLFWEPFFVYYEETDWSIRARDAGYRMVVAPKAKIWHKGSASFASHQTVYLQSRNRLYFVARNRTGLQWITGLPFVVADYLRRLVMYGVVNRDAMRVRALLLGVVDFFQGRSGRARHRDMSLIR